MGYYALAGYEKDKRQKAVVRSYMVADIEKRREYIKGLLMTASDRAAEQLPHIMPDYMLVFSVPVLTHCPRFTNYKDHRELVSYIRLFTMLSFNTFHLVFRPKSKSVYGLSWNH